MSNIEKLLEWEQHPSRTLYSYKDTAGKKLRFKNLNIHKEPWLIEQNHYGYFIFIHGLMTKNEEAMQLGISTQEYGIDQQEPDGSFNCYDAHHSAAFFLESLGRFILIIQHLNLKDIDLDKFKDSLKKGVGWFHQRVNWNDNWWRDTFHHRFFLNSAALFNACEILDKKDLKGSLLEQAYSWLAEGIRRQEEDGAITEYGGTDTGYQSLSITYATGILILAGIHKHTQNKLADCIDKACQWLKLKIDKQGKIDDSENTRMKSTSGETSISSGKPKTIKFYETAFAFRGAGIALNKQEYIDTSERIMNHYFGQT